jgi:flagellar hook-basal body complex protein FliE
VTGVRANKNSAINQVEPKKSFESYLLEAMNSVNSQQNSVSQLQEQVITNPDSVDIHDVTIAMSKARMSLELTQNVINTLVTSWNEITTTR